MSDELGLGTALADAQAIAASRLTALASEAKSEDEVRAVLRGLAMAHSLSPEATVASFDAGGALADLVRAVVGAPPQRKPRRGAPPKREAFDTFYEVCRLMDVDGLTKEKAIATFAAANRKNEHTVAKRYERGLSKRGARRPSFISVADQFKDHLGNA